MAQIKDKRNYVEQLAQEAENACSKGDIKTLYNITRQLSGNPTSANAPIRDADGKILTKTEDQLARWRDHFKQILNRPPPVDPPELVEGSTLNIRTNAKQMALKQQQKEQVSTSTLKKPNL
mgnify:CR=1 FL=1